MGFCMGFCPVLEVRQSDRKSAIPCGTTDSSGAAIQIWTGDLILTKMPRCFFYLVTAFANTSQIAVFPRVSFFYTSYLFFAHHNFGNKKVTRNWVGAQAPIFYSFTYSAHFPPNSTPFGLLVGNASHLETLPQIMESSNRCTQSLHTKVLFVIGMIALASLSIRFLMFSSISFSLKSHLSMAPLSKKSSSAPYWTYSLG